MAHTQSESANSVRTPLAGSVAPAPSAPVFGCFDAWSKWLRENGFAQAHAHAVLTRGEVRLVLHEYVLGTSRTCWCVKFDRAVPGTIAECGRVVRKGESALREIWKWRRSLRGIVARLVGRGWVLVHDSTRVDAEVKHDASH